MAAYDSSLLDELADRPLKFILFIDDCRFLPVTGI